MMFNTYFCVQVLIINPPEDDPQALDFDILISDVNETLLNKEVSAKLGVANLSVCTGITRPVWPVDGCLFGTGMRAMVSLQVSRTPRRGEPQCRNVIFLIDTGSPKTFLSASTFAAFGVSGDSLVGPSPFVVHGIPLQVRLSHDHFHDINLLGTDFLLSCSIEVVYAKDFVRLGRFEG